MEWFLIFAGIFLLVIAFTDLLQTTIQHTGAGFLSQRIGTTIWKIFLWLSGQKGKNRILGSAGLVIVCTLIIFWITCIWLGYALIFNFQADSVLHASSDVPTDFKEKIYYTGYTLSTLGNGDMKPSSFFWRILTVINSISGLLIITLSITYLLPLLSAVTNKRKLCAYISFLGENPEEIIMKGWNGKDLSDLDTYFQELGLMMLDHKEKHLLYPVLHYFHSTEIKFAAPIAFTVLDETVSVILSSPKLHGNSDWLALNILRKSLDDYLDIIKETYIHSTVVTPFIPGLKAVYGEIGVSPAHVHQYFDTLKERRELLYGMVENDGWDWPLGGEV
ncbi:MAG: potassium channel family protein [Balneolaceae bacterium]